MAETVSNLNILLLGAPEVKVNDQTLTFESSKVVALIAYLAVTQTSHQRAGLATLLWPESDRTRARGALRYTLSLLRKALPAEWLQIERQTIDLKRDATLRVDVVDFQHALTQCQAHDHAAGELCAACEKTLTKAAKLYRDEFMTGFTLRDSPAFDEWQFFQTENLRRDATLILSQLSAHHMHKSNDEAALNYAHRWQLLDPLHEPAYRQLMQLYKTTGQRAAALRQYEQCRQMLADEFGIAPSPETEQLYTQIRQAKAAYALVAETQIDSHQISLPPSDNLPAQPTRCIGREVELAELDELLKQDDIRLLNIVGTGGIGKTRLGLEMATRQRGHFADGIYFVPLAPLRLAEDVVPAIAKALGLVFAEGHPPEAQLRDYLQDRHLLLLLDNVEHLLTDDGNSPLPLITNLLQAASHLKIMTTSRVRLQLRWEYYYPLGGLEIPQEHGFEALIPVKDRLSNALQSPALTLFQQRCQPVASGYDPTMLAEMVRICRLADGMPLAIELAAAMTNVLSLPAIATEIEQNFKVLQTDWQDVQVRHRSMQAVFDSTWQSLRPSEQAVLAQLAVFRGGFTREAATDVTQASLETLTGLVNKSLLYHQPTGRYELHTLMRQYTAEKLAASPIDQQAAQQRHRDYYFAYLQKYTAQWQAHYRQEALAAINIEIDNLRVGWQQTLDTQDIGMLYAFTTHLWIFYNARGRYAEAADVARQTLEQLQAQPMVTLKVQQAELAYILGQAYWGLGHIELGLQSLYQALNLIGVSVPVTPRQMAWPIVRAIARHLWHQLGPDHLRKANDNNAQITNLLAAKICDALSQIGHAKNNQALASFAIIRGLSYAERAGASPMLAVFYANMSAMFSATGQYRFADGYIDLTRRILQNTADLHVQAAVGMRFKIAHSGAGRWMQATADGNRALRGFQQLDDRRNWGDCLTSLGLVALLRGNFQEGITYAAALQIHAKNNYNQEQYALAVCGHAFILLQMDQRDEGLTLIQELASLMGHGSELTAHCQAVYHTIIAMAHIRAGQTTAAIQAADAAVAVLENAATLIPPMALFFNHVSDVYLTLWEQGNHNPALAAMLDIPHIQTQARYLCKGMYRLAWLFPLRRIFDYLRQGQYEWLAGNFHRANRLWNKSHSEAQRLAVPYVEASAHYHLGRHLPLNNPNRIAHLNAATTIFKRISAMYDLAQVARELADSG